MVISNLVLVDLFGVENFTNAFGALILFQGAATLIGPPIIGAIYDAFKNYMPSFVVTGVIIAISGAMCVLLAPLKRCMSRRKKRQQQN